ncbi:MAG: CHRD domain-containing protein [Phototrophicaceae bacterium]
MYSTSNRMLIGFILMMSLWLGTSALAQEGHNHTSTGEARPELEQPPTIALDVEASHAIGAVYEAYPSPQQEGGEEEDTPRFIPDDFRSTAPSTLREERTGRGHAVLEFANDLSRAYIHFQVKNINPDEVVMLHLHCGRPGQLGPIIVDFSLMGDVQAYLADGVMSLEITNADLEAVVANSKGLIGAFTGGCPIISTLPQDKAVTIGGMKYIAEQGELYINLHTSGQVYFGDIRGAFNRVR